ncbi:MAG: ATP-binding protein, partial [Bacteroidota bacterium]
MEFLDRQAETGRIKQALAYNESRLVVLYGRRRLGKTRIIQQIRKKNDIYFTANQRESSLQIAALARAVAKMIPGFDAVIYPDWESCLNTFNERISGISLKDRQAMPALILDEFPYLVKSAPELPSLIQGMFDRRDTLHFHLLLSGSSQQMMQQLVLDSSAPLYGRADEIIRLMPMNVYWLKEGLQCSALEAVEEYAIWGGIPRYWEIRKQEKQRTKAIIKHIMDPHGILHDEPLRLFLDDSRDTVQMFTLVETIASGAQRLSEIASRMGKPATHLNRPLNKLIELGYIKREIPFGENQRNSKRSLYRIADPYINFYFSFVVPEKPSLNLGLAESLYREWVTPAFSQYCAAWWEELCRASVPKLFTNQAFRPGQRWWGSNTQKEQIEIDILSASMDGSVLLIGEAKWSSTVNIPSVCNSLTQKTETLPWFQGKKIHKVLFLKEKPAYVPEGYQVFTPEDVVNAL